MKAHTLYILLDIRSTKLSVTIEAVSLILSNLILHIILLFSLVYKSYQAYI